jgi:hypothetical protein
MIGQFGNRSEAIAKSPDYPIIQLPNYPIHLLSL